MVGTYEIMQGDRPVGQVCVEKQGLYYRFSCRCNLKGEGMRRLTVSCGGEREDLGVLVPLDGQFGIEKKIPCKRFPEGTPEFLICSKQERQQGKFVPVYPEEPFAYIRRLEKAFLTHQAGQLGIVIQE